MRTICDRLTAEQREAKLRRARYQAYRQSQFARRQRAMSFDDFCITEDSQGRWPDVFSYPRHDPHANDCGNTTIDNLAAVGSMLNVWTTLEGLYPLISGLSLSVWRARRDGTIRAALAGTDLDKPFGPETQDEWERLAIECVFISTGKRVPPEALFQFHLPTT